MRMNIKLTLLAVASVVYARSAAQISTTPAVLSNCGGSGAELGFKAEWTLGELAVESFGNSQYHLTQGFHQPSLARRHEIIDGIDETGIYGSTSLWPNPASDQLNLAFAGLPSAASVVKLFGLDGKLVGTHALRQGMASTVIAIDDLAAGSYVAVICDALSMPLATHRFIKTL